MENKKKNNPPATASEHEAAARALALKLLMQLRRLRKQLTLDDLAKRDVDARLAAADNTALTPREASEPRFYKCSRNAYQGADRYDIKRTKHMRSKFRRSFR